MSGLVHNGGIISYHSLTTRDILRDHGAINEKKDEITECSTVAQSFTVFTDCFLFVQGTRGPCLGLL